MVLTFLPDHYHVELMMNDQTESGLPARNMWRNSSLARLQTSVDSYLLDIMDKPSERRWMETCFDNDYVVRRMFRLRSELPDHIKETQSKFTSHLYYAVEMQPFIYTNSFRIFVTVDKFGCLYFAYLLPCIAESHDYLLRDEAIDAYYLLLPTNEDVINQMIKNEVTFIDALTAVAHGRHGQSQDIYIAGVQKNRIIDIRVANWENDVDPDHLPEPTATYAMLVGSL